MSNSTSIIEPPNDDYFSAKAPTYSPSATSAIWSANPVLGADEEYVSVANASNLSQSEIDYISIRIGVLTSRMLREVMSPDFNLGLPYPPVEINRIELVPTLTLTKDNRVCIRVEYKTKSAASPFDAISFTSGGSLLATGPSI